MCDEEDQNDGAQNHHISAAPPCIGGGPFHGISHGAGLSVLDGQHNAIRQVKEHREISQVRQDFDRGKRGHKLGVLIEFHAVIRSSGEKLKVSCEVSRKEQTEEKPCGRHGILLGE